VESIDEQEPLLLSLLCAEGTLFFLADCGTSHHMLAVVFVTAAGF